MICIGDIVNWPYHDEYEYVYDITENYVWTVNDKRMIDEPTDFAHLYANITSVFREKNV